MSLHLIENDVLEKIDYIMRVYLRKLSAAFSPDLGGALLNHFFFVFAEK
jgi:hypothetical protein